MIQWFLLREQVSIIEFTQPNSTHFGNISLNGLIANP